MEQLCGLDTTFRLDDVVLTVCGAALKSYLARRGDGEARGKATLELGDIQLHCRKELAGYKVPRKMHLVDEIVRSPAGKPDYRWARDLLRDRSVGAPA